MIFWRASLVVGLLFSVSASAAVSLQDLGTGSVQMVSCPNISDDFAKVLANLTALKASILATANCSPISAQIDDFASATSNRNLFLQLILEAQTQTLSPIEISEINAYATGITEKAGALISTITGSGECFKDNSDQQLLTALSGFVSEATNLLSSIAGPWGAPVAIGGEVVSGFLTGLQKIISSQTGFNFSDQTQWMAYVQNLCTYTDLRQDIEALLHPDSRVQQLQEISTRLNADLAKIEALNSQSTLHLGSLSLRVRNALAWVQSEIIRVQSDGAANWNNVTGKYVLSQAQQQMEGFLLGTEAPKFLQYQMDQSSNAFDDLAQYLFDQGEPLLLQAYQAGLIKSVPAPDTPLEGVEGAPIDMPTTNEADKYVVLAGTDWSTLYQSLNRPSDDLEYRLISGRNLAHQKFDTAAWAYGVDVQFCQFFQMSNLYSSSLQNACTSKEFQMLTTNLSQMNSGSTSGVSQPQTAIIRASSWTQALDMWTTQLDAALATPQ